MKLKFIISIILIIVFYILFIFYFQNNYSICKFYDNIDFDSQNFIAWNFSISRGDLPYKDFFYPYGFLPLFNKENVYFNFIYTLVSPTLFLILFFWLKTIFKKYYIYIPALLVLFLTVNKFGGQISFSRYGIAVIISLGFSVLVSNKKIKYTQFLMGLVSGIFLFLSTDQGIVLAITTMSLLIIRFFIRFIHRDYDIKKMTIDFFSDCLKYLIGYLIGLLPFLIILNKFQILNDYFFSIKELSNMGAYAKIPFLPYLKYKENVLIMLSIISTIFLVSYKFFTKQKKIDSLATYSQISILIPLMIFEAKNILRPIQASLVYMSLLMLMIPLVEVFKFYKSKNISYFQLTIYFYFILIVFLNIFNFNFNINKNSKKNINIFEEIKNSFDTDKFNKCKTESFKNEELNLDQDFIQITTNIKERTEFNKKNIFSFPADPIFYVIFKQKVAPFLNSYDGSPYFAQKKTISYMEENNINYVIYNMDNASMDGVSYYLRASLVHSYILSNFEAVDVFGKFLLMKKKNNGNTDFFKNHIIPLEFRKSLLETNLQYIPISEGKKIEKENINSSKEFNSIEEFNQIFLKQIDNNTLIVLEPNQNEPIKNIVFYFKNGIKTLISMQNCSKLCVIDTSRLPAFYNNPEIEKVEIGEVFSGKIKASKVIPDSIW